MAIPSKNRERYTEFASLYTRGKTLQEIGDQFGVSREFVRQVIKKYFSITGKDGGVSFRKQWHDLGKRYQANKKCIDKWGHNLSEHKSLKAVGKLMAQQGASRECQPIGAYTRQCQNARARGIPWELTLAAWWALWLASGHWNDRGRGQGKYVMRRINDTGPFSADNVEIALVKLEDTDAVCRKARRSRVRTKVTLLDERLRHNPETDHDRVDDSYWQNKDHFKWLESDPKRS